MRFNSNYYLNFFFSVKVWGYGVFRKMVWWNRIVFV